MALANASSTGGTAGDVPGTGLQQAKQELRDCQRRYRALFNNRIHAIAHCRVLTDEAGNPVDFLVEEINDTCAELMGLTREAMVGHRITDVFPGMEQEVFPFIRHLGLIGLSQGEDKFEAYFAQQERWFSIYAFGHEPGRFTAFFTDITTYKRNEAVLREDEQRFQAIFHNRTNPMIHGRVITDAEGRAVDIEYVMVNDALCRALNRRREEVEGRRYTRVFPSLNHSETIARLARVAQEGGDVVYEAHFPPTDRHFLAYAFSVAYGFFTVLYTDITLQKQTEAALRESEQLWRATFEQAAIGIVRVGPDGRFQAPNRKFCEMTGYSPEELCRMSFVELTYAPDRTLGLAEFHETMAGRMASFNVEKRYARKDGTPIWCSVTVTPVRNPASNAIMYNICIIEDIRRRKQAEAESRRLLGELKIMAESAERSRAQLNATFESITEAIAAYDMQGVTIMCNRAFAELHGIASEKDIPRHLADFPLLFDLMTMDGMLLPLDQWPVASVFRGDSFRNWERRMRRHDTGDERIVCVTGVPVFDAQGQQILAVVVIRDITDEKQMQAQIQAAQRELEVRVEQRTAELRAATQVAEEARRAAETANRAKSEFLATMSHEIRTPLNSVIGFAGLLLESSLDADQRQLVELGRRSGESLLHLLNDLLDFSKIEAGHLDLEHVDFDPHLEVEYVLSLVKEGADRKGLALTSAVAAPHRVRGDPARLRQILLNLVANAVKFTERGHVALRCEEVSRAEASLRLRFEVEDTGIGVSTKTRALLFQPFMQGDASTTRRFGGTGLGLVISQRLAEAMGGSISVDSPAGGGSTFRVELPFERVTVAPGPGPESAPADEEVPGTARYQGRVLIVEDNPVNQLMAARMLKHMGLQVEVAGNGEEAVEAVRRLHYDLVLMDCDMPVMDGFDASRAIRALQPSGLHVPIVAMTASALKGDQEKCVAAGMDDFLPKPVRLQDMCRTLGTWLKKA